MPTDTEQRERLHEFQALRTDLRSMPDDFTRRMHLVEQYPQIPANYWKRCTPTMLLRMDPEQLAKTISWADPTGERATRTSTPTLEGWHE